ncbi:MG2 domain-containing protein [Pseudomonas sp. NPDC007930]|uniref:alpha-2-macroglobulin family protein n=1 Tax=Pseudomonas sp. NPDC007930 TaxID=3364417 RepID=UPI0036F0D8E5
MFNKGLLLACALALVAGCDASSTGTPAAKAPPAVAASAPASAPPPDTAALAQRYQGRELAVADVSEVQLDGASALSVTFSVPLDPTVDYASKLHLVDASSGKVDGAWELSSNLLEAHLRHLEPKRKLVFTADAGLRAVNGAQLPSEYSARLETRDLQATVGFASRGSLLPTRLADGLPVIALNVGRVDVDFFRVRPEQLPQFLARWGRGVSLEYYESKELLAMAELAYTGRFDLNPAANTRENLVLPLAGIKPLQAPGLYLAVMHAAGSYNYSQPATLFSLSNIGLSAHRYAKRLAVFTQALEGGQAQAGVALQLLDGQGRVLADGQTDNAGHAELALAPKAEVLLARQGNEVSLLRLNSAALDLTEFNIAGPDAHPLQFFVFGPRDLYRPGETVLVNGLLRDADGKPVAPQPVKVQVRKPDEQASRSFVWQPGANGLYQYALPLAAEGPTGRWQLQFDLGDGKPQAYSFQVEDFLPERMALELKGSDEPLAMDAPLSIAVSGRYLYGAPAAGNRLTGQVYVRPLREAVASLPGYQFGSASEEQLSQDLELDDSELDAQGQLQLSLDSQWQQARSPLEVIVQASLQEAGGRPVTRTLRQPVWPAERLVGIRPLFGQSEDDNGQAIAHVDGDGPAEFELLLADANGHKLGAEGLKVRLVRERRDYYWNYSDSDGWSYNYNARFLNLSEDTYRIAENGTLKVSVPVEWGPYRLEAEDPQTGLTSSVRFWAGYAWQDNTDGGAVRPDQVKLALDKPAYAGGDEARVTVTPPAAGKGYLMVESGDGPLWWQEIDVPAEGKAYAVKLDPKWARHDLYLSALVVRPGERKANVTPKRAVGLLHLPLDRAERKLALQLQAPDKIRPNRALAVRVQARNADGSPARQANVLVSAVDAGVLNITDFATPDPFTGLYGRKAYGADQLDVYGQLIEAGGRLASLAFGGDAGLAKGGKRPDTQVTIVAQQATPLALNEQGEGEVSLAIPDFNGELRLMAQAWSAERVGMAEAKVVVAAPLIAELAAPRFLAGGDRAELALDVSNLSGQAQEVTVALSAEGLLALPEAAPRRLSLAAGQRTTLRFPVLAAAGFGQGTLQVRVDGLVLPDEQAEPLQRQWTIGVRPAYPAQQRHYRAVLERGQWQLPDGELQAFEPAGLEAWLSLSSRPPLNLAEQIQALKAYPYGCLEQTASGLYPSLYADAETLTRLGLEGEPQADRERKVALGIERLLGMQRDNGGFGLWSADSPEEYWLTAYVGDFLLRAREQGYAVPAEPMKKTAERLLRYLQEPNLIEVDDSDDAAASRFAVQAYAGFVLARSQQAPLGALRAVFERRSEARSGLALVQLAIALGKMGDAPRAEQALQAGLAVTRARDSWLHDYGTPLRDQAMILARLEENHLGAGVVEQRLFALADQVAANRWLSTQERNALFLAGRGVLGNPEKPWAAEVQAGGSQLAMASGQEGLHLQGATLAAPLSVSNRGEQPLYQQLTLSGYPAQAPAPIANPLAIRRDYLTPAGKPLNLDTLKSGDLVLVHLAVSAKQRVPDALVVDLLPAGLEIENQNLGQSAASLENASSQVRDWVNALQAADIRHQEARDDRYVAALNLDGYGTTHLLYLARAVTPGSYRVPPPQVEAMYRPGLQGLGEAPARLTVNAR